MRVLIMISLLFGFAAEMNSQVDSVYTGQDTGDKRKEKKKDLMAKKIPDTFTWGGDLQAWIGRSTYVLFAPTVGFIPYKNFNASIGMIYHYTSYSGVYGKYSQSIFGGHSFLRYTIGESYFLQVQFDKLRQPDLFSLDPNDKVWVDYLLVGGGFKQSITDKVALTTSIMYNVNPDPLSIYFGPLIVQFGVAGRF